MPEFTGKIENAPNNPLDPVHCNFVMSSPNAESCPPPTQNPTDLKPCCACPETRKLRDDCVFMKGEENCTEFIEKHKKCLESYGFKV